MTEFINTQTKDLDIVFALELLISVNINKTYICQSFINSSAILEVTFRVIWIINS